MVTNRLLEEKDEAILTDSLSKDSFHKNTTFDFFLEQGTISNVYELNDKPVLVVRACKSLRLDIQYLDNNDFRSNMKVMLEGFPELVEKARENGFKEIVFVTTNPVLKKFCTKYLGFTEVEGEELRRII